MKSLPQITQEYAERLCENQRHPWERFLLYLMKGYIEIEKSPSDNTEIRRKTLRKSASSAGKISSVNITEIYLRESVEKKYSFIKVEPKNFLNVITFVIKFSGNPISDLQKHLYINT